MYLVLGAAVILNLVEIAAAPDQGLPGWPFVVAAVVCLFGAIAAIPSGSARD